MKRKNIMKKLGLLGVLVGAMAFVACGNASEGEEITTAEGSEIVIKHELGTTTLEEKAENIAVLELSFLDSLYNLDITPVAIADDNDAEKVNAVTEGNVTEYTSVGKRMEPNLEELSMMDLDLIIADASRHSEIYEDLSKIAPTIILNSIDSDYEEYKQNFEVIAEAVGKVEEADKKIEEIDTFIEEISELAKDKVEGKTVLTVSPKNDEYTAHTSSSFVGGVLQNAGFTNVIQSEDKEASLSLEQLVEINPDIIVYMRDDKDKTIYAEWKDTELYNTLDAVNNGQVYTTVARGPWTQYRGFVSVKTILGEMKDWLLN